MLSANLLDKATGAPLFDAYKIIERAGWRVALLGVVDGRGLGENLGEGLAVEDMEVTLGRVLPQLKDRADCIVLLAFADEAAMTRLARQFYELDVILGGNVRQPSQQLVKENRSLILATTNESRAVGIMQIVYRNPHLLGALKGEVHLVSDQIPQDESIAALATACRDRNSQNQTGHRRPHQPVPGRGSRRPTAQHLRRHRKLHAMSSQRRPRLARERPRPRLRLAGRLPGRRRSQLHRMPQVGFGTASGYRREVGEGQSIHQRRLRKLPRPWCRPRQTPQRRRR